MVPLLAPSIRWHDRRQPLLAALADARTLPMISGSEAAALRAENALLKARPWWRKWFR
jgi:hypothetical protein